MFLDDHDNPSVFEIFKFGARGLYSHAVIMAKNKDHSVRQLNLENS